MAKLSAAIKTDRAKSQDGVRVHFGSGIFLRIARLGNPAYQEAVRKLMKPHQDRIRRGDMTGEEVDDLSREAIARHVLVGWENIEDDEGKPIAYSSAKALEFLRDPDCFELYEFVVQKARSYELFRRNGTEDSLGNLPAVSSGVSTGDSTPIGSLPFPGQESA